MESLGDFLKKGREEAGLSLETLAQRTRIRIENLDALEREDLDALPTDIYVRGFVKLVCRELGIAPEDGLVRYEALRSTAGPPDEIIWSEDLEVQEPNWLDRALRDPERAVRVARSALRWGGLGLGGVLVVVLAVAGGRLIGGAALKERTAQASPPTAEQAPPPKTVDLALVEPTMPQPRVRETPPPAQPKPAAPRPAAAPAVPKVQGPASVARKASPPASRAATPSGDQVVLVVEAIRPVEVEVLLDGVGQPRSKRLAAGERKAWKADNGFLLSATDGGALRLTLDNVDLGVPGQAGEPLLHASVTPTR